MIITKKEEILFYSLIQTPSMTPIIPKTTNGPLPERFGGAGVRVLPEFI